MAAEPTAAIWAEARRVAGEMGPRTLGLDLTPMALALSEAEARGAAKGIEAAANVLVEAAKGFDTTNITGLTFARIYEELVHDIRDTDPEKL